MKVHLRNVDTGVKRWHDLPMQDKGWGMHIGDEVTIAGVHSMVHNPDRRWWQFWKPKFVKGPLQVFKVLGEYRL